MRLNPKFLQQARRLSTIFLVVIVQSLYPNKLAHAKPSSEQAALHNTETQNRVKIAQASPIRGRWRIRHSNGFIAHESILMMYGSSGKMITRYYDRRLGQMGTVVQTMKVRPSARGLLIVGYRPVYPGTDILHPRYSPDAFLFRINPNGSVMMLTCDAKRDCSPVEISRL